MTNRITAIVVAALSLTILSSKTNTLRPAERLQAGSVALHKASQQTTRRSWDELAREVQSYWTLDCPAGRHSNSGRFCTAHR